MLGQPQGLEQGVEQSLNGSLNGIGGGVWGPAFSLAWFGAGEFHLCTRHRVFRGCLRFLLLSLPDRLGLDFFNEPFDRADYDKDNQEDDAAVDISWLMTW